MTGVQTCALPIFGDGLLRFSVGIEAPEDLVADLRAALDRAEARTPVAV